MPNTKPAAILRAKAQHARVLADCLNRRADELGDEVVKCRREAASWLLHAETCERGANLLEQSPDL